MTLLKSTNILIFVATIRCTTRVNEEKENFWNQMSVSQKSQLKGNGRCATQKMLGLKIFFITLHVQIVWFPDRPKTIRKQINHLEHNIIGKHIWEN